MRSPSDDVYDNFSRQRDATKMSYVILALYFTRHSDEDDVQYCSGDVLTTAVLGNHVFPMRVIIVTSVLPCVLLLTTWYLRDASTATFHLRLHHVLRSCPD